MSPTSSICMFAWGEDLEFAHGIVRYLHGGVRTESLPLVTALALRLYGLLSPDEMCEELPAICQAGYGRSVGPSECRQVVNYIHSEDCLEWKAWLAPRSEYEALKREASNRPLNGVPSNV